MLRLTAGDGCVRLLRDDEARGALLLERLGPSLYDLALPVGRRHEILCAAAERVWRPAPGGGLPTGADHGRRLAGYITATGAGFKLVDPDGLLATNIGLQPVDGQMLAAANYLAR